jgi:hypothetical protein
MHTIVHVGLQATECRSGHSYTLAQCGYGDVVVAGPGVSVHASGNDKGEFKMIFSIENIKIKIVRAKFLNFENPSKLSG